MRRSVSEFVFTPSKESKFVNISLVDDDVLEFDEVFIAEFDFPPWISNKWNIRKGIPSSAYIMIRNDDG